jgi:hypothetical protein
VNSFALLHTCDRVIACKEAGTYDSFGSNIITVDVHGRTNVLKGRMPEKDNPEIYVHWHPSHRVIACQEAGTYDLAGTYIMAIHPLHKNSPEADFMLISINKETD